MPHRLIALLLLGLGAACAQAATVNGTVRRSDNGAPIEGAFVALILLSPEGNFLQAATATTSATGAYSRSGLADGDWRVSAGAANFSTELWQELPCPPDNCNFTTPATPIPLAGAQVVNGIDFTLEPNGTITGTVRRADMQAPLANVSVFALTANRFGAGSGQTDANGQYTISAPAGSYFIVTSNDDAWIDQVHDDLPCAFSACAFDGASAVTVVSNQNVAGIDFNLQQGGRLSGQVSDAGTGLPVAPLTRILVHDASGQLLTATDVNPDGSWRTAAGAPSGDFRLIAEPIATSYGAMVWNNRPCAGEFENQCEVLTGDLATMTAPAGRADLDFALRRLTGELGGRVTQLSDGAPLVNVVVDVQPVDPPGSPQSTNTDVDGRWVLTALLPRTYQVTVNTPGPPLLGEQWPGIQCLAPFFCGGTPQAVPLARGETRDDLDFALAPLATLSIALRNSDTAALMSGELRVLLPGTTNAQQFFAPAAPVAIPVLSGGDVRFAGRASFCGPGGDVECLGERFPDEPCVSLLCELGDAQPINVPKGQAITGIELVLGVGGTIEGTLTAENGGTPIPDAIVNISTGDVIVANAATDPAGDYRVVGLGLGPYFARTQASAGFIDELYDDIRCPLGACSAITGTPLNLAAGGTVGGIDFALSAGAGIQGRVVADDSLQAIGGALVHLYDALGNAVTTVSTLSDGTFLTPALGAGTFHARAEAIGFAGELYQELPCPVAGCDPLSGTAIAVSPPLNTQDIDFSLSPDPSVVRAATTLYLNRCSGNCVVRAGFESSINDTSSIISGTRTLPTYPFDDGSFDALVQCVAETFAPFNVQIVTSNPSPQSHHELMLTTVPGVAGFGTGVGGVSPFSCGPINNAITYVFAQAFGDDTDELCAAAAMELAHSFGLEHAFLCEDPMTYLTGCGRKRFTDLDVPCGEYGARPCDCGGATTNSYRKLVAAVGGNPIVFRDGFEDPPPQAPKRVKQGPPFQRQVDRPHCDTMSRPLKRLVIPVEAKSGGSP